jgi:uncharacterized protein (DUF924 family)
MQASDVLEFWFVESTPKNWFTKDLEYDKKIIDRFMTYYNAAIKGELFHWRETIEGRLAEIIVLDQFSRNMFRADARSFQYDSLALVLAQEACDLPEAKSLEPTKRAFLYMPFMHSESLKIHEKAVELFSETGLENNLEFEHKHRVIIERFGRYPHRNEILGRESSAEEIEFLKGPNSSF